MTISRWSGMSVPQVRGRSRAAAGRCSPACTRSGHGWHAANDRDAPAIPADFGRSRDTGEQDAEATPLTSRSGDRLGAGDRTGCGGRRRDPRRVRGQLGRVGPDVVEGAGEEERLLGQLVDLALEDLLERGDGVLDRDVHPGPAGEHLGHEERLAQKRWRRRARATVALSSSDSSSMPRIAMMSWRSR